MKAFQIFADGSYTTVDVTREYLLNEYPIYQRDLRPIILIRQAPTITVRKGIIILSFGFIRMIITKEYAYVFNIRNKFIGENLLADITGRLMSPERDTRTPFEFLVIETALHVRIETLSTEFMDLERDVAQVFELLRQKLSEENFEKLLYIKNKLSRVETHVSQVEDLIKGVLEDEHELQEFSLSSKSSQKSVDEIESIFEHYYEQTDELWNSVDDLRDNIEDYEQLLTMKLSNIRNTIIQFDLIISVLAASFGIPTVIVGLYGMNVPNAFEGHTGIFWMIGVVVVGLVLLMIVLSLYLMRKKNIL